MEADEIEQVVAEGPCRVANSPGFDLGVAGRVKHGYDVTLLGEWD